METISKNKFSNEIELILLCSNLNINDQDIERIRYLSAQDIDWFFLKEAVIQNRVHLITYKNFKAINENIPADFISQLKELVISTGGRNLFFSVYLQKILSDFNQQGIFVLPFKGPVLSEQVYKDSLLRPFSDLDILVNRSDTLPAFHLLKKRGLIPQLELKESQIKKYFNDEDHFTFYNIRNKIAIELHWDISGLYLSRPITTSDLKKHITTGTINKAAIPCLSSEALLVYLCVHGAKHGWESLEQVCSVSELIKINSDLDWEKIKQLSSDWGCRKMLMLGLNLSTKLFKAPVPFTICTDIARNGTILEMTEDIIGNFFNRASDQSKNKFSDRFSVFHIKIRDSYTDKIRYVFRLLFRPTDKEWQFFPVPAPFSFVHYFLRPFRLLFCKLKGDHA